MVLEILASRVLAPYVGVSLYTWTSIIGIVLAGISLGAWAGGRASDRWTSEKLLGVALMMAGGASLGVLAVDQMAAVVERVAWALPARVILLTFFLFLPASLCLGAISPIAARLWLRGRAGIGSTVGHVLAVGAAGSILGTFAAGFVLISWFGTRSILIALALSLWTLGALYAIANRKLLVTGLALGTALALIVGARTPASGPCDVESNYHCIQTWDYREGEDEGKVLVLDRMVHSYSFPGRPERLVQGFPRIVAQAMAYQSTRGEESQWLFLGGGGYVLPRYALSTHPAAAIDVVEIDSAVTEAAQRALGLAPSSRLLTHHGDAREFLRQLAGGQYDLIVLDAFNDLAVPFHLTTQEFATAVRERLSTSGLYVLNIVDSRDGVLTASLAATLEAVFEYVYSTAAGASDGTRPSSTIALLASDTPLDPDRLRHAYSQTRERIANPTRLRSLSEILARTSSLETDVAGRPTLVLTDDYAPVDQMLAQALQ